MVNSKKAILIVAYDWPPRNSIATHRPFAWAKYWSEMGAEVFVITAKKYTYDEPLDLFLQIPKGVNVIEVPYWPEKKSRQVESNSFHSKLKRVAFNFLKKNSSSIKKLSGINFDIRDGWAKKALPVAAKVCQENDVGFVVSTYGPRACHVIGHGLKVQFQKLKWIADYRDMWSLSHLSGISARQRKKESLLERRLLKFADLVTTVSKPLAMELSLFLQKDVRVICNGFDAPWSDVEQRFFGEKTRLAGSPLKIVYTGIIYQGRQNPEPLFLAINKMIKEGKIHPADIKVDFFGHRQPGLHELVSRLSASGYVKIHGHVPRDVALNAQTSADLLLLLESGELDAKGILTGKVFEYLASGRPILSLGSRADSAIGDLLLETGTGVTCQDDLDKIEQILISFIESNSCKFYVPRLTDIKKYSRSIQAKNFLEFIFNDY